jgi:hypothetical protein
MSATERDAAVPTAGIDSDEQGTGGEDDPGLSRDEIFEILSNHRRRFVLHHLQNSGDRVELGELSEHVAAWENGQEVAAVTSAERKRVYTSLQQFHLPKMDEKGVVTFDDRAGVVELEPVAEDVDVYLEVVEERDVPWSQYYLGLGAVNLGLLLLNALGVFPFTILSGISLGLFVATTFLVSALVHTYVNRTEMHLGDSDQPPEAGTEG